MMMMTTMTTMMTMLHSNTYNRLCVDPFENSPSGSALQWARTRFAASGTICVIIITG